MDIMPRDIFSIYHMMMARYLLLVCDAISQLSDVESCAASARYMLGFTRRDGAVQRWRHARRTLTRANAAPHVRAMLCRPCAAHTRALEMARRYCREIAAVVASCRHTPLRFSYTCAIVTAATLRYSLRLRASVESVTSQYHVTTHCRQPPPCFYFTIFILIRLRH